MNSNWEKFQEAYQNASDDLKQIVDSTQIPTCVSKVVDTKKLDSSHYRELVNIYSLHILGALTEETLLKDMSQIGIPEARAVLAELQQCRQVTPITPINYDEDISADIAEAEAALESITHKTTPSTPEAKPKETETIYTSTQSAILEEHKKTATAIPRWESET